MNRQVLELQGRTRPWSPVAIALIALWMLLAWTLRLHHLAAQGFADDEVHKWLAANRYLHWQLAGDDVEHPMLMKWLIAGTLLIGRHFGWAPETITRLPNAVVGGISVWVIAQLGRRLFGRAAGLIASGLAALSTTFIGYQRIAKEDTLLGLFLMVVLWAAAEAKAAADDGRAAEQRGWELTGAVAMGLMLASKYFPFYAPIPVVFYLWVKRSGTRWEMPFRKWFRLSAIGALVFAAVNWTPFFPSSWAYGLAYVTEKKTISGSLTFMGTLYHNLPSYGLHGTPPWFYLVFTAVKLAPTTVIAALIGLAFAVKERRPSQLVVLSWLCVWFPIMSWSGSKWGRFYLAVHPAFMLLAASAAARGIAWVRRRHWSPLAATAAATLVLVGPEAQAAVSHMPDYRLYISPLGGGDRNIDWFFPHCDYFDTGFREVVADIAARAEPNAELCSEIDWPARYYAGRFGRPDLKATMLREDTACREGRVCYVVLQSGRIYFPNESAWRTLATKTPWLERWVRGKEVLRVYRLEPGESPFGELAATR